MSGVQKCGEQGIWPLLQHLRTVQLCNLSDRRRRLRNAAQTLSALLSFLSYLATVHDEDAVCVHYSVDPVGDGEHGAVPKGLLDGGLDQSVRLGVDGCCRLIQEYNLLISGLVSNKAAHFSWNQMNHSWGGKED